MGRETRQEVESWLTAPRSEVRHMERTAPDETLVIVEKPAIHQVLKGIAGASDQHRCFRIRRPPNEGRPPFAIQLEGFILFTAVTQDAVAQ